MASLFESLAVTGHRKSDGSANASGKAFFYKPGGTSPTTIYADEDEHPLTNPVTLSAGGKAQVFFTGQVDVFFEDFLGNPIETLTLSERAERVEVKNAGFTGLLPSGSQGAGGATDLGAVLASIYASVGGLDGKYLEYTGATARPLQSVIRGIQVSVKDYGAVGNGVADDTVAITNAANEVQRLGGGTLYFPPGTYSVSSAIAVSGGTSINFRGAGAASIIKNTNGTANCLTFAACSDFEIEKLKITHSGSSTGFAVSLVNCSNVAMRGVVIAASHAKCVSATGTTTHTRIDGCFFTLLSGTTNIGVYYSAGLHHTIAGSTIVPTSGGKLVSYDGTTAMCSIDSCYFTQTSQGGIVWESTLTGLDFDITNCPGLGAFAAALSPAFVTNLSVIPRVRQVNNGLDGGSYTVTTGGTVNPDFTATPEILITGTTTGAAYTVNAPTILPHSTMRNYVVIVRLNNSAGAPITGWNFNAIFKFSAAISLVDAQKSGFIFLWDGAAFREIGRAVTT